MLAKRFLSTVALVLLALAWVPAFAQQPDASSQSANTTPWGPPFWASGEPWFGFHPPGHELTVDEVKDRLQRWIAGSGDTRLKVGNVTEKDSRTISAEILTADNSQKIDIDRRTGMVWQMDGYGRGAWRHWGPAHWSGWGGPGRQGDWGGWRSFPFFGMFFFMIFIFFVALLVAAVLWRSRHGWWAMSPYGLSLAEELALRYARGKISREEYLRGKKELPK